MRRVTVLTTLAIFALTGSAHAKGAIANWDRYPETVQPGQTVGFTLMVPRMRYRHPLVTFRSASGRIVRVRLNRADLNGIAYGRVAFPDKGPWGTEVHAGARVIHTPDEVPFEVGVGLTQTIPAADATTRATTTSTFPWLWVFGLGSLGCVLLSLAVRRRGRWGAA